MEPDSVELAQFREQWKAEVQNKRKAATDAAAQPGPSEPSRIHAAATQKHPDPERISAQGAPAVYGVTVSSQKLLSALQIYRDAIHHEQNGDLDNALVLYRKAFRLVFSITYNRFLDNLNYFRVGTKCGPCLLAGREGSSRPRVPASGIKERCSG